MAGRAERAAALAWDAARAADEAPAEHPLAAAAAAALALDNAVDNAKDCIQVLGGIGFTWEHDAHLYLRRALALRQLLGGSAPWRIRTAELAAAGARRHPPAPTRKPSPYTGIAAWAIPAVQAHGTPAQRDRFTDPAITWCQLFSEPEAGSDLAGLRTRARTAARRGLAADRPEGVDVAGAAGRLGHLPGPHRSRRAQARGAVLLRGGHARARHRHPAAARDHRAPMFNEVFLDDMFVADDCVLGAPGDGWRVAMSTLATEREKIGAGKTRVCKRCWPRAVLNIHIFPNGPGFTSPPACPSCPRPTRRPPRVRKLLGIEDRQADAETALAALGPAGAVKPGRSRGVPAHPVPQHRRRHHPDPAQPGRGTRPGPTPVMDFIPTESQQAVAALAAEVLAAPDPWKELARAGLLDVTSLGLLDLTTLLTEIGRPRPLPQSSRHPHDRRAPRRPLGQ